MRNFQKIEDKKEREKLLKKALFKTFFHSLEWEEFLEKTLPWLKFEHYLYKKDLFLSLARYKIFKKEKLTSHPFGEYGGPVPLKEEIDGTEFKRNLFLEFKTPLKISFHPQIPKYFRNLGFEETESQRDTYFIENFHLKTEDELLKSFTKTTRQEIKKAQSTTCLIKKCQSEKELRAFYDLYIKIVKKHKTIPYPFSFFKFFLEHNPNSNTMSEKIEIVLAKFKNRLIAGSVFLFYEGFIHYFLNASDENYKNLRPNYLILWNQMKNYCGKSHQFFDLGGTKRGSTLEIFKRGWQANQCPIFEIKNYKEKLKESGLRNILGIFPCFLIKKLPSSLLKFKL